MARQNMLRIHPVGRSWPRSSAVNLHLEPAKVTQATSKSTVGLLLQSVRNFILLVCYHLGGKTLWPENGAKPVGGFSRFYSQISFAWLLQIFSSYYMYSHRYRWYVLNSSKISYHSPSSNDHIRLRCPFMMKSMACRFSQVHTATGTTRQTICWQNRRYQFGDK